jgi:sugar O-acyltransferase (sialic acid O-acetyltransferase NeuD family)
MNMACPIAIFGAGGFAREVLQIIHDLNAESAEQAPWHPVGFIVDAAYVKQGQIHDLPILGSVDWLKHHPDTAVVIAVGSPAVRQRIARQITEAQHSHFATLIHPKSWIGRRVSIGTGSVICAGALITTDIQIGQHVHINLGCTIGHDAALDDFVTLNPAVSVSGNVHLGFGAEIGTRSTLIPQAHVGEWSIVGAGAVVTKELPSNITAVGAPAKVIKQRDAGWQISI